MYHVQRLILCKVLGKHYPTKVSTDLRGSSCTCDLHVLGSSCTCDLHVISSVLLKSCFMNEEFLSSWEWLLKIFLYHFGLHGHWSATCELCELRSSWNYILIFSELFCGWNTLFQRIVKNYLLFVGSRVWTDGTWSWNSEANSKRCPCES